MSKKTVPFKMPVREIAPPVAEPAPALAPSEEETGPIAPIAQSGDPDSDGWVRRRSPPAVAAAPAPAAARAPTLDLAAERDFAQTAVLMATVPMLIAWHWQLNAMNRLWRRLG
jgi:hypothetical protein